MIFQLKHVLRDLKSSINEQLHAVNVFNSKTNRMKQSFLTTDRTGKDMKTCTSWLYQLYGNIKDWIFETLKFRADGLIKNASDEWVAMQRVMPPWM